MDKGQRTEGRQQPSGWRAGRHSGQGQASMDGGQAEMDRRQQAVRDGLRTGTDSGQQQSSRQGWTEGRDGQRVGMLRGQGWIVDSSSAAGRDGWGEGWTDGRDGQQTGMDRERVWTADSERRDRDGQRTGRTADRTDSGQGPTVDRDRQQTGQTVDRDQQRAGTDSGQTRTDSGQGRIADRDGADRQGWTADTDGQRTRTDSGQGQTADSGRDRQRADRAGQTAHGSPARAGSSAARALWRPCPAVQSAAQGARRGQGESGAQQRQGPLSLCLLTTSLFSSSKRELCTHSEMAPNCKKHEYFYFHTSVGL